MCDEAVRSEGQNLVSTTSYTPVHLFSIAPRRTRYQHSREPVQYEYSQRVSEPGIKNRGKRHEAQKFFNFSCAVSFLFLSIICLTDFQQFIHVLLKCMLYGTIAGMLYIIRGSASGCAYRGAAAPDNN